MAQPAYLIPNAWAGSWKDWREEVVSVIRAGFPEVLQDIDEEDIDWEAWRSLFDRGHSPESAVDQAFVRIVEV